MELPVPALVTLGLTAALILFAYVLFGPPPRGWWWLATRTLFWFLVYFVLFTAPLLAGRYLAP